MFNRQEFNRLRNGVLLVSLLAWVLLLARPDRPCCCLIQTGGLSWGEVMESNPPSAQLKGWGLMLVAMMAPTLVPPIYFIRRTSLVQNGLRLVVEFVAGYGAVWMLVGVLLLLTELAAKQQLSRSLWPATIMGLVALVWQASPWKQICLNRCHNHRPLSAFGFAADWDAVWMGFTHGIWCVGSCWALMLFPMLLPVGQHFAMAGVTLLMFCERMDPGAVPCWRLRGFRTAFLYLNRWLRGPATAPMPFPQ